MIIAIEGTVRIQGDKNEVLAEATTILHNVYCGLVERYGKEEADDQIADIAQLAVMSEKEISELAKAKVGANALEN